MPGGTIGVTVFRLGDQPVGAGGEAPVDGGHAGRRGGCPHYAAVGRLHRPVAGYRGVAGDAAGGVGAALPLTVFDGPEDGKFGGDVYLQRIASAAAQVAVVEGDSDPLRLAGQEAVVPFHHDLLCPLAGKDGSERGYRPVETGAPVWCNAVGADVCPADVGGAVYSRIFRQDGHPDEGGLQAGVEAGAVFHRQFDDALRAGAPVDGDVVVIRPAAVHYLPVAAHRPEVGSAAGLGGVSAQRVFANGAYAVDDRAFARFYYNGKRGYIRAQAGIVSSKLYGINARAVVGGRAIGIGGGGAVAEVPAEGLGILAGILKQHFLSLADGNGVVYGSRVGGEAGDGAFQDLHAFGNGRDLVAIVKEGEGHRTGSRIYPVDDELKGALSYYLPAVNGIVVKRQERPVQ